MAEVREDDTISDGLISTPVKSHQLIKERVGINARSNMAKFIGHSPLLFLNNITSRSNGTVVCKLEDRNPAGGLGDRVALAIISNLEAGKHIIPGKTTLVEASCGSGGTGLAFLGAVKGYKVICVIQDTAPVEKRVLAKAYGAEIVVTPSSKGVKGVLYKAQQIVDERDHAVLVNPWEDEVNVRVHHETTGPEIWEDTHGLVDVFIAPVNTGGTITGVGQFLKAKKPGCQIVAVEPLESAVLSGGKAGAHKLQDIGSGCIPPLLNLDIVDEVFKVSTEQGTQMARLLAKKEGLLGGPGAGAAVFAAVEIAKRPEMHGKLIVAMVGSSAEQHLSTLYEDIRRQCQSLSICRESEFRNMPKDKKSLELS